MNCGCKMMWTRVCYFCGLLINGDGTWHTTFLKSVRINVYIHLNVLHVCACRLNAFMIFIEQNWDTSKILQSLDDFCMQYTSVPLNTFAIVIYSLHYNIHVIAIANSVNSVPIDAIIYGMVQLHMCVFNLFLIRAFRENR